MLNILCLEDSLKDSEIIRELMIEAGYDIKMDCTEAESRFVSLLKNNQYDIILSDFKLPGFDGFSALKWSREICPAVPFICVSGSIGENTAVELLKKGAVDYVIKDRLDRLPSAVQRALDEAKEKKARQEAERHLHIYAETQSLLLDADNLNEIYTLVADKVSELIGQGIVATTLLDESSQTLSLVAYRGLNVSVEKLAKILQVDPIKTVYNLADITEEEFRIYRSGKLEILPGGLFALATRRIPMTFCKLAERLLKIEATYTMGFMWHGLHFGGLVILAQNNLSAYQPTIELLVNQAVNAINRIRAERALRNSEEKFSLAFKTAPYAITITDPKDGNFVEVNDAFYAISGFTPEEARTNTSIGLKLWHNLEERNQVVKEILAGRRVTAKEYRFRKKNGDIFIGLFSAHLIYLQNKAFILSSINDITERKRTEDALQQSYTLNESLLKTIPYGMDIVDEEGMILFQSETLKKLLKGDFVGKRCWEIYRNDKNQCPECPLLKGITIGETGTFESKGILGDRILEICHTGIVYGGRKVMLEIFQDITDRKKNEVELINAKEKAEESDQLKTSFLHNISHEIRTPMNAIVGFSGLLNDPGLSPEKSRQFTDIIIQNSNQLLSIITDIIDISTIEAGQEKLNLNRININSKCKLIYDQFTQKAKSRNISFRFITTLADCDADVVLDETKFIQILTNLLDNAFKFINKGHIYYGYELKNDMLEFYVEDTGIGVRPEMHGEVFKRFRQVEVSATRRYGGSGLGLSISKAYVELHGGKIWLDSEIGKGSVFYFTLPYDKAEEVGMGQIQPAQEISMDKMKPTALLIAEDEDYNFMLLQELLADSNFSIIRALNGVEAVEMCKLNKEIDLVLMDIKMPVMDGYEATKQIRQFNTTLPIVAQTAYSTEAEKLRALKSGCNDFISKPFRQGQLISKIKTHLNNK